MILNTYNIKIQAMLASKDDVKIEIKFFKHWFDCALCNRRPEKFSFNISRADYKALTVSKLKDYISFNFNYRKFDVVLTAWFFGNELKDDLKISKLYNNTYFWALGKQSCSIHANDILTSKKITLSAR